MHEVKVGKRQSFIEDVLFLCVLNNNFFPKAKEDIVQYFFVQKRNESRRGGGGWLQEAVASAAQTQIHGELVFEVKRGRSSKNRKHI